MKGEKRKEPLYPNLVAELKRRGIRDKDYGKCIGVAPCGTSKRLKGDIEFTIGEMQKTKELLGMDMDYLFETNNHAHQ